MTFLDRNFIIKGTNNTASMGDKLHNVGRKDANDTKMLFWDSLLLKSKFPISKET